MIKVIILTVLPLAYDYIPIASQNMVGHSPTLILNCCKLLIVAACAFFVAPIPTSPYGAVRIINTRVVYATGKGKSISEYAFCELLYPHCTIFRQWGYEARVSKYITITFPVVFSKQCYSIIPVVLSSGSPEYANTVAPESIRKDRVSVGSSASGGRMWIALGV